MMLPAFIDGPIAPDADVTFPLDSVALQREYLEIIEALDGDAPSHALGARTPWGRSSRAWACP